MLVGVEPERVLPTVRGGTTYVLSLRDDFIAAHRNKIFATWLFDGDYKHEATSKLIEDRKEIEDEFLRRIRKRRLLSANTFCLLTIYLEKEEGETENTCANCATTIEQTIQRWAEATNEICVVALHLEQTDPKRHIPAKPHIHVIYQRKPDKPKRLYDWMDKTIFEPRKPKEETEQNEEIDDGLPF